jgi:hypothetical protein
MQLTLKQQDIETAITKYIASMGITGNVTEITFSHARKGGANTVAEVSISPNSALIEPLSTVENPSVVNEPVTEQVQVAETEKQKDSGSSIFG